jgi:HPt (histidine-containing phosphotransfer) domain-containing protein
VLLNRHLIPDPAELMTNYSGTPPDSVNGRPPQNTHLLLDTDTAMASMGGKAVYLRILNKFAATRSDAVSQLREALNIGDQKQARHLVHTLKGVAATIGASYLSESARKLEILIEANIGCESQLISTASAMIHTLDSIKSFQSSQLPAQDIKIDSSELDELIAQLNLQLDVFDASASDTMLRIKRQNITQQYNLKQLIEYMDAYDYENARLETRRLTGK